MTKGDHATVGFVATSRSAPATARPGRTTVRAVFLLACALLLIPVVAQPAFAHGRGSDATNYASTVNSATEVAGATWSVYGGDELLALESLEREVVVLGYSGEPYLRVGPDGVFRNANSPATYLNEDRFRIELPPGVNADPDAAPEWQQVSSGSSYAWHDHRVHLMTTTLPGPVEADPGSRQVVQQWSVPFLVEGVPAEVQGELVWVPGPSPWPWLGAGLLVTLGALAGIRSSDPARMLRPAAATLALVGVLNVTRVVDDILAMPLPLATIAFSVVQTVLFTALGLLGAWKAWRGGDGAFTALAVGSAALLVGQGLLFWPALSASQLTSVLPDAFSRFVAAASIAQALPVGAVAVVGNRRMMPDQEERPAKAPSAA